MIKNERQYRISKAAARKFRDALSAPVNITSDVDPVIAEATSRALASQLSDLEDSLLDYEKLRSGTVQFTEVETLDELPTILIRARIAAGLTQKELADRMGLSAQQIQRYEESEYQTASFSRLLEVAKAIGINIRHEALLGATAETVNKVLSTLSNIGLPKEFITRRLAPVAGSNENTTGLWLGSVLNQIQRIFDLDPNKVLAGGALSIDQQPAHAARFKVAKGRNEKRLSAYTVYAHYLAMLLIDQLPEVKPATLPNSPEEFYDAIAIQYETVSFETTLRYVWSLGIGVIPLSDDGSFDGAYWRVANRHVIALKPNTNATARWFFDLLHDYFHATQHKDHSDNAIIELPPNDHSRIEDPDEIEASEFASDVAVAGLGDELWNAAAEATDGNLKRLKGVLPDIARQLGVDLSTAAYYMAHRLMAYQENWWGTANNLQRLDDRPWEVARDILLENVALDTLALSDRKLLQAALQEKC